MTAFESSRVADDYDLLAPDGSEIRLLHSTPSASVVHCSLPVAAVSLPVRHHTVEEIWYFLAGRGQVWRAQANREDLIEVQAGISLTIPLGTSFQFRNTGDAALEFIIVTMPPWPGADEAILLDAGKWDWA